MNNPNKVNNDLDNDVNVSEAEQGFEDVFNNTPVDALLTDSDESTEDDVVTAP